MGDSIILFDGVCNLCNGFVQFVVARDSRNVFKFGSLQSAQGRELLAPFNCKREILSTVFLIQSGNLYSQSTAALRILKELDGVWRLMYGFIIIPPFLRDAVYAVVAKYRYSLFGRRKSCMIPTPELQNKFIDP